MFIQTYHTDGSGPTFRAPRSQGLGASRARPSPAAFLRRNLDLTPASLARRGRAAPPEPGAETGRGGRRRRAPADAPASHRARRGPRLQGGGRGPLRAWEFVKSLGFLLATEGGGYRTAGPRG